MKRCTGCAGGALSRLMTVVSVAAIFSGAAQGETLFEYAHLSATLRPLALVEATLIAAPGESERLLAEAETFEELRFLMSQADQRRLLLADPLLRRFVWERFTAPELLAATGLSSAYRKWLFETLLQHGGKIGALPQLPNFRLLPMERAASWPGLYRRSFLPYEDSLPTVSPHEEGQLFEQRQRMPFVTTLSSGHRHDHLGDHAHLRYTPTFLSPITSRPLTGMKIRLLNRTGDWYYVETADGVRGYIRGAELQPSSYQTLYSSPDPVFEWKED